MSGSISATNLGSFTGVLTNAAQTQRTIDTLTAQSSSGFIAADYAGLADGARTALDLTGQLALNTADQADASRAATVNQVAQTALGQIQTLVSGIASQLLGSSIGSNTGLGALAASADGALGQMAALLNTKVGQVYVFAGQDSRTPPVPDAADMTQSAFYAAIQGAVANLSTSGVAATQSQLLGVAAPGATSPFSATLEATNQVASADLGGGQRVQLGVLADQNTNAVSAGIGTTSTGSYMRDVLMALSTVGSLGAADATDPQVQALLGSVHTTLSGADDALNTDIGGLGARQDTITEAQTELTGTATTLTTQLGNVQDADPAATATKLAAAQTQLQASYKIISDLSQLSLAKYL